MAAAIRKVGEQICKEPDTELQSMLSAAFVRLSQEASTRKSYAAVGEVCATMERSPSRVPCLRTTCGPRIGVENRLPEFIEEALHRAASAGTAAGSAAHQPGCRRASCRPLFPLLAAR